MFQTILSNFHLEKIFWIIKSKLKYMILAAMLLALGAGFFAYRTQSSTYVARISFYAYSNPDYITDTGVNLSTSEVTQARSLLDSYMQILRSNRFLTMVLESLNLDDYGYTTNYLKNRIGATSVSNTTVFIVSVYDEDPMFAMMVANAIGELAPAEIIRIVKSGGIEVLDSAELPTQPYASTSIIKYALLGAILGFVLVAGIALIKGLLDTTVRRKYEIEDIFTIPILGTIPRMVPQKKKETIDLLLQQDSPFVMKEAYSDLRTNLLFTAKGEKCPVYALTSADPNEGKSLNSINIARSFAQAGKRVLIVDADMRKSELHKLLRMEKTQTGLSEYLAGMTEQPEIANVDENLDVIFSGMFPPNPTELLMSDHFAALLEACRKVYDVILMDLPPVGIVSDALAVGTQITAYILVVCEQITKFDREEMIVRKLEALGANICGFIYNGISMKSPDYNYKQYGYETKYKN
ncbi:MAG: polysaccharide biosynthesis tyrosine autokinase [Lachnospiraceae bacterium]|nr:polysaccharide biosynthesis tyrosine autokinase [Lachnospiraceae bacterium]